MTRRFPGVSRVRWGSGPLLLLQGLLIVFPLTALLLVSLNPRIGAWTELSFDNYTFLLNSAVAGAATNTFIASFGGTVLALVLGVWLAWLVARTDVPFKGLIEAAAIVPLFISPLVAALAWSALGAPRSGLINTFLKDLGLNGFVDIHSLAGIIFVFGLYYAPYIYLFTSRALMLMDPSLEEAARMSGASGPGTLLHITLPLARPAMLGAIILVFVMMVDNFSVPAVLGAPGGLELITTYLYKLVSWSPPQTGVGAAVGMSLILFTGVLVALQRAVLGRRSYVTVTGKGIRPRLVNLGRAKWIALLSAATYLIVAIVIPYLVLIQVAFRPFFAIYSTMDLFDTSAFTWQNLTMIRDLGYLTSAPLNSLFIGLAVAFLGGVVNFALAFTVHRTKLPGRGLLQYLAMLPVAVPGIVMGLAYLLAFLAVPLGLYGTIWIIALAYVSRFMPQGFTSSSSSIIQVHTDLEETARVSGANLFQTIRRISYPLMRQGVLAGMVLLFILSVRELNIALFLYTSNTAPMSVAIFDLWETGLWGATAMMSLIQGVFLFITVSIARFALGVRLQLT